jgi:hypothetical protein
MTIQDLGALGELLGSVAVLVTLIYLAFQTRQNTMAISAQLDAARISAVQGINLAAATSTELLEALNEDRIEPMTTNQARREHYWTARFFSIQWNFIQARRGLLPGSSEARMALRLLAIFNGFRSIEGWWEARTTAGGFDPGFVEWVEEQRAKAA